MGKRFFARISRSFVASVVFAAVAGLLVMQPQAVQAATATFQVSDYRSAGANTVNNVQSYYWRGYIFTVAQDTTITKLVGGGAAGFQVAVYPVKTVTGSGSSIAVTPGNAIGHASNISGSLNEELTISGGNADDGSSIALTAGTQYLLASGRLSGNGYHWTVSDINVDNILLSPRIGTWGPNVSNPVGKTLYWSNPPSSGHDYTYIQNTPNNAVTGTTIPALGFQYTIADIDAAAVTTAAPTFSGNNVHMNGQIDSTGGGETTMAIIYGQSSDLSSGSTVEILGTTNAVEEDVVSFYFDTSSLASGTWYYRARGENDSGSTLGSIKSFGVQNVTYTATKSKNCTASAGGGSIDGATTQKLYSTSGQYASGSSVTAEPNDGFVFVKWCDNDSTDPTRTDTSQTASNTVYAQFAPQLTFDSQGGSAAEAITAFAGDDIVLPEAPTRPGYTFMGWNTEADGTGTNYNAGAEIEMPTAGFSLYATWVDSTDKNNDGTPDALQTYVTSFTNPVNENNVTIELDDHECSFNSATAVKAADNEVQDTKYEYNGGMVNFSADCSNSDVIVTIYQYGVAKGGLVVRKYNPNTKQYATISDASLDERTIDGQTVTVATYTIKDGGDLDTDGEENGTIVDPVGLASPVQTAVASQTMNNRTVSLAGTGQTVISYVVVGGILIFTGLAVVRNQVRLRAPKNG